MKRRSSKPKFGSVGTKMIEYLANDGVGVFGPYVTREVYRFRPGKNPRPVDVRDLTMLTKAAGRDNLRDVNAEPRVERPKRVREKPKQEKQTKSVEVLAETPVEQEEVTNDAE